MNSSPNALNANQWLEKLEQIAANLGHPTHLCLIGSAAGILSGQPARTSMDLDVLAGSQKPFGAGRTSVDLDAWGARSRFSRSDLKQAVEKAGLLFDPKEETPPEIPYSEPPPPDYEAGASAVKRTRDADLRPFRRGFPAAGRDPFGSGP